MLLLQNLWLQVFEIQNIPKIIYFFSILESRRQKRSLRQKHKSESGRHNTMTDISEHSPPPYEKSEDTKF